MAVCYVHHSGLGKAKYDRQGAIAHIGYILRPKAAVKVFSRHMPATYREAMAFVGRLYDESRKNARVYDKLILNLPRELSTDQHVQLLRSFLDSLTRFRTPYLCSIHGDKPDNPHAHIVIRDADVQTRKRVALLSAAGSTYKIRALWERFSNQATAHLGIAISRWGKHSLQHRFLNAEAKKNLRHRASTALTPTCTQMHPDESSASTKLERKEEPRMLQLPGETTVHQLLSAKWELEQIQLAEDMVNEARNAQKDVSQRLAQLEKALAAAEESLTATRKANLHAQTELNPYLRFTGTLKGFSVTIFGKTYKTGVRRRAEAAQAAVESSAFRMKLARNRQAETLRSMKVLESLKAESVKSEAAMSASLASYGSEEDIREAKELHKHAIARLSAGLSQERLDEMLAKGQITPAQRAKALAYIQEQGQDVGY